MKKVIFFLVAVSFWGTIHAQKVTQIKALGSAMVTEGVYVEVNANDTFSYKGQLSSVWFRVSFEFTNGNNQLNAGDSVIIEGRFAGGLISDDEYSIDGKNFWARLFTVPEGGIEPNGVHTFEDGVPTPVQPTAIDADNRTLATAKCLYTSADGSLLAPQQQDVSVGFYLIQDKTSISESALAAVKVFPTLASNELQFINLKHTDVAIYSLVGQQMMMHSDLTGNVTVDISSLPNGIYFVKIQNGNAVRTEKIKIVR